MLAELLARFHLRRRPPPAGTGGPPAGVTPLWAVRLEFMRALNGIRTQQAGALLDRIGRACSLRDLWHLRAEVFKLVAHHRDRAEAHSRLAVLNRHFPVRASSSGSGLVTLDTTFRQRGLGT